MYWQLPTVWYAVLLQQYPQDLWSNYYVTIIVGVSKGIVLNNSTFAPCICKILGICYSPTLSSFWEFGWLFCSLWDSRLYMCFHRNRATNLIYYVALWLGQEDAPSYWSFNCICNSSSELFPTDSESIHSYVVRCKLISAPLFLYYCGLDYDGRVPTFFFLFNILKHIHVWKCNILPYVLWWTGHGLLVFCFSPICTFTALAPSTYMNCQHLL